MPLTLCALLLAAFGAFSEPALEFRISGGDAVVTQGRLGIESGWKIERIGSQSVPALIEKAGRIAATQRELQDVAHALVLYRMSGGPGEIRTVTFRRPDGKTVTCEVPVSRLIHGH